MDAQGIDILHIAHLKWVMIVKYSVYILYEARTISFHHVQYLSREGGRGELTVMQLS